MTSNSVKSQIARIAALRAREAYRAEKSKLIAELNEARRRGEDQMKFLAAQETQALSCELLGRRRS